MSSRTPFPFRDHHDREQHGYDFNEKIAAFIGQYEDALANEFGPTADADVVFYNEGRREAYEEVLVDLLGIDHALLDAYWGVTTPPASKDGGA